MSNTSISCQSPTGGESPRLFYATILLQFLISSALFRIMGNYRLMDTDEGHFLSAIRSVYEGLVPSRDFFFQQMPLFPYPYAASMWIFGYGYEPCIWVSVLCGAGLAAVVSAWFIRYGDGLLAGWIGWLLVMLNAPILFWTPTIKNHAMPLFFGILAIYAALRQNDKASSARLWGALAGFSAVWSVGTRLLAMPFALLAIFWFLLRALHPSCGQNGRQGLLGFLAGALPPLLLIARSIFPDPWAFYFNNLGYHAIRSGDASTFGSWDSISAELSGMLHQAQFPALLAVALGVSAWKVIRLIRQTPDLAGADKKASLLENLLSYEFVPAWLTLFGIGAAFMALLPAQTFHQYFLVPLLFFILATVPMWQTLLHTKKTGGIIGVAVILVFYGGTPCNGSIALFNHQEEVFPRYPKEFALSEVRPFSALLAKVTGPEDIVLSTWQGFTFLSRRREFPGNENFNARIIAGKLTPEQLHRLHIATNSELAAAVDSGEPKAIVFGFFAGQYRAALSEFDSGSGEHNLRAGLMKNYRMITQSGSHSIWLRKDSVSL